MTTERANFPHEAIAVIDDVLQYGRSKHVEGSWRSETLEHHVNKAQGHIKDWLYEVDRGEDNLACALTRMAMALAVRAQAEDRER
jgi:hypothetical protein